MKHKWYTLYWKQSWTSSGFKENVLLNFLWKKKNVFLPAHFMWQFVLFAWLNVNPAHPNSVQLLLLSSGLLSTIHEGESCINHQHSESERQKPGLMQLAHLFVMHQRSQGPPCKVSSDSQQQPDGVGNFWEGPEASIHGWQSWCVPCPPAPLSQPAMAQTGCPEELWLSHPCKCSGTGWVELGAPWSGGRFPACDRGLELDEL